MTHCNMDQIAACTTCQAFHHAQPYTLPDVVNILSFVSQLMIIPPTGAAAFLYQVTFVAGHTWL